VRCRVRWWRKVELTPCPTLVCCATTVDDAKERSDARSSVSSSSEKEAEEP